jgi:hypothetical protein
MAALIYSLEYEVAAGPNVPAGLPRLALAVLSPIWEGESLTIDYPDGEIHRLEGRSRSGASGLKAFWTRHRPGAPAVCLVIGGDAGLRNLATGQGHPFLALAERLIPPEVREVVGPRPPLEPLLLL